MLKTTSIEDTLRQMRAAFNMTKQRCLNPRNRDYPYYGGRGITIDPRWLESFNNFVADMGLRPPGMTLERKENSQGYAKDNCIWASKTVQMNNTRQNHYITWQGVTATIAEWERRQGWKAGVLKARLRLGYTVEEAMSKSVCSGATARPRKPRDLTTYLRGHGGIGHPSTKLTAKQVKQMRKLATKGESFSALGRMFGVTVTTASNAVQSKGAYKNV